MFDTSNNGGYQYRVRYYAGNRYHFTGAHLFNDKRDALKFMSKVWFRSPELLEAKRSPEGGFHWKHVNVKVA